VSAATISSPVLTVPNRETQLTATRKCLSQTEQRVGGAGSYQQLLDNGAALLITKLTSVQQWNQASGDETS